jgi:hypothetical protein
VAGGIEGWFAYVMAFAILADQTEGLFGEKHIDVSSRESVKGEAVRGASKIRKRRACAMSGGGTVPSPLPFTLHPSRPSRHFTFTLHLHGILNHVVSRSRPIQSDLRS